MIEEPVNTTAQKSSGLQDLIGFFKTIKRIIQFGGWILFLIMGINLVQEHQESEATTGRSVGANSSQNSTKPTMSNVSSIQRELIIGGRTIRVQTVNSVATYSVPELARSFSSQAAAVRYIREGNFQNYTGIRSTTLIDTYMKADTDGNGKLSFPELEAFQKYVYNSFKYQNNGIALRPDEFLARGGGDCDDFSLFTAGLLRFWGWEPYIGLYSLPDGSGHAVCLSYESAGIPSRYYYENVVPQQTGFASVKPGKYVPIDYDLVGALTNAVPSKARLTEVLVPETMWGLGY